MAKEPTELTPREPFGMMTPLREAVNRLFEESFINPARFEPLFSRGVPLDIVETDHEYIVEASLPGVKDEDLKVSATENSITIRASVRREERDQKKDAYVRRERYEGEVVRSVTLANPIDPSKVSASYERGVLKLTVPKSETAKPHEITIAVH